MKCFHCGSTTDKRDGAICDSCYGYFNALVKDNENEIDLDTPPRTLLDKPLGLAHVPKREET